MLFLRLFLMSALSGCSLADQPAPTPVPTPPTLPAGSTYEGIPTGFDFPGDNVKLEEFRQTENVPEMRRHAWNVWAGINHTAQTGGPVWETWFSVPETFAIGAQPQAIRRPQRAFTRPRQHESTGIQPQAVGQSLLSFVLFNRESRSHIRTNNLNLKSTLTSINIGFPVGTSLANRTITDFPREAVALKILWWHVKKGGLTPIPIWHNDPANADAQGNDWDTWKRVIAVDPSRSQIPPEDKADVTFLGIPRTAVHVVPLASFYHFQLATQEQVDAARQATTSLLPIELNDYVALVCMHMTTKEIDDWVWATFWWHDRPNDGPFARHRTSNVNGVWQNYLMDTAFDMVKPRESDNTADAVMNPWLEARFPNGMVSNCMTCHQRSVWPAQGFLPVTRGGLQADDPYFQNRTKVDFLWSLAYESQP